MSIFDQYQNQFNSAFGSLGMGGFAQLQGLTHTDDQRLMSEAEYRQWLKAKELDEAQAKTEAAAAAIKRNDPEPNKVLLLLGEDA